MDGIEKLKSAPTRALKDIVAHCRPYFDCGASEALPATDRRQYYAALFTLAERGDLLSAGWRTSDADRPRDDRERASQRAVPRARRDRARKAA